MWRITPEERAKHDQQFMSIKPVGGMVTGMSIFYMISVQGIGIMYSGVPCE